MVFLSKEGQNPTAFLLGGCINISTRMQPEDTSVKEAKTGSDCVAIILGFGFGTADVEQAKAKTNEPGFGSEIPARNSPIIKVRRVEMVDRMFLIFGERCVEVTGE